jgi:1-phosphatidylinositol-3-phosphate 5-kinase
MRTELAWPRILLLKPSLEHDCGPGVTSLEANMRQEDEHMEMVVHEMAKLRVDLLLVGGSVCFTAKEKLLKRGIALAVGVKPQVLERISRCTNTTVLLSPAQVAGATPGTCGRWRVEYVTVTVPPAAVPYAPPSTRLHLGDLDSSTMAFGMPGMGGAASAPTSALVPAGTGAVPGGHAAPAATKRVTLMYFERCPPELLATVVLRGGDYSAQVFLLGAEFTRAWTGRLRYRKPVPVGAEAEL